MYGARTAALTAAEVIAAITASSRTRPDAERNRDRTSSTNPAYSAGYDARNSGSAGDGDGWPVSHKVVTRLPHPVNAIPAAMHHHAARSARTR